MSPAPICRRWEPSSFIRSNRLEPLLGTAVTRHQTGVHATTSAVDFGTRARRPVVMSTSSVGASARPLVTIHGQAVS
jgi:hypothetical protein